MTPELAKFCRVLREEAGAGAIIAKRSEDVRRAAREILVSEDDVFVHWGRGFVLWPGGGIAYLVATAGQGLEALRGLRLDVAIVIEVRDFFVPVETEDVLRTLARGPGFQAFWDYQRGLGW